MQDQSCSHHFANKTGERENGLSVTHPPRRLRISMPYVTDTPIFNTSGLFAP